MVLHGHHKQRCQRVADHNGHKANSQRTQEQDIVLRRPQRQQVSSRSPLHFPNDECGNEKREQDGEDGVEDLEITADIERLGQDGIVEEVAHQSRETVPQQHKDEEGAAEDGADLQDFLFCVFLQIFFTSAAPIFRPTLSII